MVAAVTAAPENPQRNDAKDACRCARLNTAPCRKITGRNQRDQHVEKQLNAAARGEVDTIDVVVPLQMVLSMEGVTCLPQ
ncbi:MAG: hypothetical protein WBG18_22705 [Xanthobacteraceae bacterium]